MGNAPNGGVSHCVAGGVIAVGLFFYSLEIFKLGAVYSPN